MHDFISNEKDLLEELQKGNKNAYHKLFETYYKLLFIYAKSLTQNKYKSEDIVQNVFLKLWLNRENIIITTSIKNYLYTSVHNIFINDYLRTQKEITILHKIHGEVLQELAIEEDEKIMDRLKWVDNEIQSLPKKAKEIFIMNKKRGLTSKEIANMLNISENTVESHIGRVLKRLRVKAAKLNFLSIFF
ncbi:RNA polymerase sigma-70 factor [Arenibacter sp. S6351L]|uniref:RNA polymerase sigma factor n=1 Tax=Arenibacter sp. S6351L TaxID=2926407 RepID=UPI001FF59037|nr:RNA polymerase sigma-70 factor [Arenibacter sp. S6351L]MCK0136071.1 RNA polymerase sigma-70 factor [Arenibacter sp. S6351L]